LVLTARHNSLLTVAVNQVDCDEECLREKLELEVHLDKPVHENATHALSDFCLDLRDTGGLRLQFIFTLVHVIGAVGCVEGHVLGVIKPFDIALIVKRSVPAELEQLNRVSECKLFEEGQLLLGHDLLLSGR